MGSAISGLFGGGSTQTSGASATTNAPWGQQQPYLLQGLQQAQQIYDQRQQQGPYTGAYYSPINSMQTGGANQANNFATGPGSTLASTTANTAGTLQGAAPGYVANATNLATNGAGSINPTGINTLTGYANGTTSAGGVASPLSDALQSAAVNGANAITTGQQNIQQAAAQALQDPTAGTISAAEGYSQNPAVDAAIKAAEQPVLQTLNESTLPGLNAAATAGGNLNSSRAGMAEAMANRDAASQMANIEGTIRGNAYTSGLNLAAQQREAGLNTAVNAGTAGANTGTNAALGTGNQQITQAQLDSGTQIGASNNLNTTLLGQLGLNASTELGANGQLGTATGTGVAAASGAGNVADNNFNLSQGGGGVLQTDQNAQLANAYQQWQMANGYDQGILNNYWGIVGQPLGSQQTSASTQTVTPPSNVVGGLAGLFTTGASFLA